jgi:ketosteroid isomerase-like protein
MAATRGTPGWTAMALLATASGAAAQGAGGASSSATDSAAAQMVLQVERQYLDARVRNDTAALGRVLAEDFLGVGSRGQVGNRARALTSPVNLFPDGRRITAMDVDSTLVRVYGGAAVLTGRRTYRLESGDPAPAGRFTHVYVRRRDRWQLVSAHLTGIAPPALSPR